MPEKFSSVPWIGRTTLQSCFFKKIFFRPIRNLPTPSPFKNELFIFINKIKSISHGIFQNLRKLEVLDLCRNLIDHLDENTFSHCEKLRTLFFHKNDLELLPKNLFRNIKQLLYVNLSQNKLVHIPAKLFAHTSVGALMLG